MKHSTYCLGKVVAYLFICLLSTVIIVLVRLLYICLFVYEVQYLLLLMFDIQDE
jgi:hypothetical protein